MADLTPGPYELALLALAAARTWKLLADDVVLERPRQWVLDRIDTDDAQPWEYFLTCPWCAGAWISLAWWGAWAAWAPGALALASVAAISALVGGLATWLEQHRD